MNLAEARARIQEHSLLNAFISVSSEEAIGTAVGVKDLVDVAGFVTTAGGTILPREPASNDAPVISKIRAAGCVIVGKTNLHEFAFGVTSVNPHFGTVRNPHDPSRVAGGSSGGSAVAVATGMCDWAIGTDTGGSIRIPASLCGVVGFKPQRGSINMTGVIPLSWSLDSIGPLARDTATAALAYSMMSGEEVPTSDLGPPRVAVPAGWVQNLDAATAAVWSTISKGIAEVEFPSREALFGSAYTIMLVEAATYHRRWASEYPDQYGQDVIGHIRAGLSISGVDFEEARRDRATLQQDALAAMDGIDALLLPATAIVAPGVDAGTEVREPLARFTRPFNATDQPAIVLPAHVDGLPVGIQIVGKTNVGTLRAAMWIERQLGHSAPATSQGTTSANS